MQHGCMDIAALIGDLVASREAPDRVALQDALNAALTYINATVPHIDPCIVTLGDEFQGTFAHPEHALAATALAQCHLGHGAVRFGIGVGTRTIIDPDRIPFGQDGPAWWAARAAIDTTTNAVHMRTGYQRASETLRHPNANMVHNMHTADTTTVGLLGPRDTLFSLLNSTDRAITLGLFAGESQSAIGGKLGITQSAVSQRARRLGLATLAASIQQLLITR